MIVETMNGSDKQDILNRLPKSTDEAEQRITRIIELDLLKWGWSKSFFYNAKKLQIDFFKFALKNSGNPEEIYKKNQRLLKRLSQLGKTHIVSGEENLVEIPAGNPFFIVTNHLGDYKLSAIEPSELGLEIDTDQIHPFPMYYAPYSTIASKLEDDVSAAHIKLLDPLFDVEKASGLVTIVIRDGGLARLEDDTRMVFANRPNTALVVFPEGGTTGKRNGKGSYDLEEFHSGAFVIAGHLGVPVLPVGKYFDPDAGYKLGILPPIKLEKEGDHGYYKQVAVKTQQDLQNWLNAQKTP